MLCCTIWNSRQRKKHKLETFSGKNALSEKLFKLAKVDLGSAGIELFSSECLA